MNRLYNNSNNEDNTLFKEQVKLRVLIISNRKPSLYTCNGHSFRLSCFPTIEGSYAQLQKHPQQRRTR